MNTTIEELTEIRNSLQFANDSPNSGISDTLWMIERPQTIFDAIDSLIEDLKAQALLSQGELVAWLVEGIDAYTDYARAVGTAQANMRAIKPLFLTQPSTESLQKDKAEMIAYIENLLKPLQNFVDKVDRGEARSVQSYTEMKNALAIPQPQCMQEG